MLPGLYRNRASHRTLNPPPHSGEVGAGAGSPLGVRGLDTYLGLWRQSLPVPMWPGPAGGVGVGLGGQE